MLHEKSGQSHNIGTVGNPMHTSLQFICAGILSVSPNGANLTTDEQSTKTRPCTLEERQTLFNGLRGRSPGVQSQPVQCPGKVSGQHWVDQQEVLSLAPVVRQEQRPVVHHGRHHAVASGALCHLEPPAHRLWKGLSRTAVSMGRCESRGSPQKSVPTSNELTFSKGLLYGAFARKSFFSKRGVKHYRVLRFDYSPSLEPQYSDTMQKGLDAQSRKHQ